MRDKLKGSQKEKLKKTKKCLILKFKSFIIY